MTASAIVELLLPWSSTHDDARFKKILIALLAIFFLVAIPVSLLPLPALTRAEKEQLPPQLARVLLEKQETIPIKPVEPPPPRPVPKALPAPTHNTQTESVQAAPIEPRRTTEVKRPPLTTEQQKARNVAQQSGLMALTQEMNELTDTREIEANIKSKVRSHSANTIAVRRDATAITAGVATQGEVVDETKLTGNISQSQLETRTGNAVTTAATERAQATTTQRGTGSGGRGAADISIVFDKNKASLYSLYDRERRKHAGLKGKIVFELTISASGKVTDVKVISSELNNPELEARLANRIKLFIFAPSSADGIKVNYPVELLP